MAGGSTCFSESRCPCIRVRPLRLHWSTALMSWADRHLADQGLIVQVKPAPARTKVSYRKSLPGPVDAATWRKRAAMSGILSTAGPT